MTWSRHPSARIGMLATALLFALFLGASGASAQAPQLDLGESISPGQADLDAALNILAESQDLAAVSPDIEIRLRAAVGKDPSLADAWSNLAILLLRTARSDEALKMLDDAIQQNPAFADGYAIQGVIREARGESAQASALFEKSLGIDEMNAIARNRKSAAAIAQKDWRGAIPHVRRALVDNPGSMNAYLNLAVAYFEMGLHDLARLVCNNGLQVDPASAPLYNMLGLIRLKSDDVRGALREFNKAIEHDPDSADALLNAGAIALNVNDFKNGLERFERVISLHPDHGMAQISRGVALRGLGRMQDARNAYLQVIARDPRSEAANYNLCILLQEHLEDFPAALQQCRRLDQLLGPDHARKKEVSNRLEGIALMLEDDPGTPPGGGDEDGSSAPPEASNE